MGHFSGLKDRMFSNHPHPAEEQNRIDGCLFHLDKEWKPPPDGNYGCAPQERSTDNADGTDRWKREARMEEMRTLFEKQPRFWTCGKLAVRYGVSRQQIARDVAKLRRRGIAVLASPQGYFFDSDKKVSPTGR